MLNSSVSLQVLCPCAKRRERRDETELLDEPLDDSDTNTLGLSAQDLRDPAAIVSLLNMSFSIFNLLDLVLSFECVCFMHEYQFCV